MKARVIATEAQLNELNILYHVPSILLGGVVEARPVPSADCVWVTRYPLTHEFAVPWDFVEFIEEVSA